MWVQCHSETSLLKMSHALLRYTGWAAPTPSAPQQWVSTLQQKAQGQASLQHGCGN